MGRRGPKKAPQHVAELRGSWRAKKRSDAKPSSDQPTRPPWLRGEARAEWDRQAEILAAKGLLSRDYQAALAMYCEAWGEYVECIRKLQAVKNLITATDKGNLIQHPLVSIRNKAFDRVIRLGQQFGFSPTAQVDVPVSAPAGSGIVTRKR